MKKLRITEEMFTKGTRLLERQGEDNMLLLSSQGAGILLPQLIDGKERYAIFYLEALEEHSVSLNLLVYRKNMESEPAFDVRFGILPGIRTLICMDLNWLDASTLFPEREPGALKFVCHGGRIAREDIERIELSILPAFHDLRIRVSDVLLSDEYPGEFPLPDVKLIDELGQYKKKEWSSKISDVPALKKLLSEQAAQEADGYPFEDWSAFGGWKRKKLTKGTGYFTSCKADGKWWLADPEGYAFFSMGPDCVNVGSDCRIDGLEKWLDWLPDREDPAYGPMFHTMKKHTSDDKSRRTPVMFSYQKANLYRVWGDGWYDRWKRMITGQLRVHGLNTLGNWSDERLLGTTGIPYVTSLPWFPETEKKIFRDFPDVFSEEYRENAVRAAAALEERKDDPLMVGYFLRNEPSWAFVDHLILADEVLYNPEKTACRDELVRTLKEKYGSIQALNRAWSCSLESFDSLYGQLDRVSGWSQEAYRDMKEFSRRMLRAYVEIPSRECRKADPNHMILGMRWAWISDPDLVTGWENFDVFSINCYAVDPTAAIQNIVDLGVDLPVMIGEFHFGALDAGVPATGLEGVESQEERGVAYRYYCERVAAHPNGVGCHYFQCYDQFALGRFDGENYNIGLFDICSQAYPEMMRKVRECSRTIYEVADGEREPADQKAKSIPMIAY